MLQGMQAIDSLMATLLVTCWLTLSAVLMLNLLIALLSNTFQRYVSGLTYTFQRCGPVLTKPPRGTYASVLIETFQRYASVLTSTFQRYASVVIETFQRYISVLRCRRPE